VSVFKSRQKIEDILSVADIQLNGNRPWDMHVHTGDLYPRLLAKGSLGLGESYAEGWWDCDRLDKFFTRILRTDLNAAEVFEVLKSRLINLQKPFRAFEVGQKHYDIGNNLFRHMLDKRLIYSGAYWKDAVSLDEVRKAKLDLICRMLDPRSGSAGSGYRPRLGRPGS